MKRNDFLREMVNIDYHNSRSSEDAGQEREGRVLINKEKLLPKIVYPLISGLTAEVKSNTKGEAS